MTKEELQSDLIIAINAAANIINNNIRSGSGNYIITSAENVKLFDDLVKNQKLKEIRKIRKEKLDQLKKMNPSE